MKIAICDDSSNDIEMLRQYILKHSTSHKICEFTSPAPFIDRILANEQFDLLFLDIQMPDANGWEIAKELKLTRCPVYIVLVTILGEYIYDCFDRVDWFLPKPFSQERIFMILEKAQEKLYPKVFTFESEHIKVSLTIPEIIYMEVRRNNLHIVTNNNNYCIRMPLKAAVSMLSDSKQFVQIHNSYIFNLAYFKDLNGSEIVLKNGTTLRLTRTYRKNFFDALAEYIRGV